MFIDQVCDFLKKPRLYYAVFGVILAGVIIFVIVQSGVNRTITEEIVRNSSHICTSVTLPNGKLRGRAAHSSRGREFYAFQEIPYAKPPLGELRFREPSPVEKWTGVLDVTRNTKPCFQYNNFLHLEAWAETQTEDCLYLNVYTPVCPSSGDALNVMFYVFGSGYLSGASDYEIFGPNHLMDSGIVVVTFNYRLGPLGFISAGDEVIPGNYGMKDQVLALKWVNQNIEYFGGDPNKVTIIGHSSGASSVGLHLMSKSSRGLYTSAICMSGTSIEPWAHRINHKKVAYQLAGYLDSSFNENNSSEDLLQLLRKLPARDINEATWKFPDAFTNHMDVQGFIFTPVIEPEHETAFVTESMYSVIKEGRMDRVPLLIGLVSEEALNLNSDPLEKEDQRWKDASLEIDADPANVVLDNMHIIDKEEKKRVGEAIRNLYPGGFTGNLGKTIKMFSDTAFNRGIIRHAELQSNFSDVYFYRFSYYSQSVNGLKPNFEGAYRVGHGDDNSFLWVFNRLNIFDNASELDILTSDRYKTLITNFMKFSNPTPNETALFNGMIWPKVRPDNFQYLDINETVSVQKNMVNETYLKWVEIYENLAKKPLINSTSPLEAHASSIQARGSSWRQFHALNDDMARILEWESEHSVEFNATKTQAKDYTNYSMAKNQ